VCSSDLRREGFANSLRFLAPNAEPLHVYDKIHLFPGTAEERHFLPGRDLPVPVEWQGLRIGVAICFDLRFPELFRAQSARGADVFVVPAQWPAARDRHWSALLTARAVENQCHMVGVNACGESIAGLLGGGSRIVSPLGETLASCGDTPRARAAAPDLEAASRARRLFDTRSSPFFAVAGPHATTT